MNTYRRLQNIRIPEHMRPQPKRTSISRTVREIEPASGAQFSEIGKATIFEHECLVATASGKFWVILEVQTNEPL